MTNLHYRLVNQAGTAARAVTIDVTLNGEAQTIVDRGSFAPGFAVERDITAFATDPAAGSVACRVTHVVFRDDTAWNAAPMVKIAIR